ncbi:CocE/NonD family hydrolase [Legionella israelensis]|uniref:Cocaine esterase n=1 Tax=Legionella israelensis TaxID=454 RepID=A0A0W0WGG6_9GAMM|nr:CocE/NonD family hydrolase [Legionella israelensis]KTD31434.1 Cocaine esterase [Legionella israelensis]QBS09208.1 CocE/NonD family hydrolase [Legionella israelensis]SCY42098.1 hypothetical protein SAMN02746069_02382 [Legionella israelensis DSM 19235]STX58947.1 Cocaine esterase [Legionella israelensis]
MKHHLKTVRTFPHEVKCIENIWIPLRDGARLAARLWIPENVEKKPVPAIVEYIPYRKRDFTRFRDTLMHPYFAGHGYACLRVDLRGAGDSEGVLKDEYLEQELTDGLDILDWLGRQNWCTGEAGIIGISWGGFNGLQIAALKPPQLKAIISLCSTDDRYADDIHHMGGCLLGDNLSWASVMFSYNSLPPDPKIVGDRWRDMWLRRLNHNHPWIEQWLRHQRRDDYWKHGSVCENYSAIKIPVYAISGWADGYSNAVFRMLEHLDVPRKGLIGPWSHKYPHLGVPGPAIGFLQEALRWWDKWLKGIETGIMNEPMLRVWMQSSVHPMPHYERRPGRWVAEPSWPSPNIKRLRLPLGARRIAKEGETVEEKKYFIQSPLTLGLFAGKWCSYAAGPDMAYDQREEDGGAMVFDSDPLDESLEILGAPRAILELSSDKPIAMIAVRISDISLDSKATRVTYGLLNLTHRDSSERPEPLEPGRRYLVEIKLNNIAQVFPEKHRIRIAISSSYWPLAWPPPESARLTLYTGKSALILPVRPRRYEDKELALFGSPEAAPATPHEMIEPGNHNWLVHRDLACDKSILEVINDNGLIYIKDIDLKISNKALEWYTSQADDFSSIRGETQLTRSLSRGDWQVKTVTHTVLTSNATDFCITADLDAYENEKRIYCKSWHKKIKRDFV